MITRLERAVGAVVRNVVPHDTLLMSERIGDWYDKSEAHKRKPGDVLMLQDRSERNPNYGFGSRPIAFIEGLELSPYGDGEKMYSVAMERDTADGIRERREELHFKWNMDFIFRKIPRGITPEQAVELYRQTAPIK